jgi:hypothetical protein
MKTAAPSSSDDEPSAKRARHAGVAIDLLHAFDNPAMSDLTLVLTHPDGVVRVAVSRLVLLSLKIDYFKTLLTTTMREGQSAYAVSLHVPLLIPDPGARLSCVSTRPRRQRACATSSTAAMGVRWPRS